MSDTPKRLVFNISTGEINTIPEDQIDLLQDYETLLVKRPKSSCKACYGRGYTGYDPVRRRYDICRKCGRTMLDFEYAKQQLQKAADEYKATLDTEDET